ncbi:MAG: hypothetical protein Q9M25_10220 [Mariprofundaceae bacterium]|nr:hypothetical protein [Mariprofundaceae bacterium]
MRLAQWVVFKDDGCLSLRKGRIVYAKLCVKLCINWRIKRIARRKKIAGKAGEGFIFSMAKSVMLSGLRCCLLFGGLFLVLASWQVMAGETQISVVRGNFIYAEDHQDGSAAKIAYQVEPAVYQGIDAWRISWNCDRMDAVHYIRRSDGTPLYAKRINHILQRTVEVLYSLDSAKPHIYRRESRDETVIRRIRQDELMDLGALPQVLSGLQASTHGDELHFSSIDYNQGEVYALLAKRVGYRTVKMLGESIRCAIYDVNLDSWKAAFNPAVRVLVPVTPGLSNFAAYAGPDPAGSGEKLTFRMLSRDSDVAVLQAEENELTIP